MDVASKVIAILAEQALLDPADVRPEMTLAEIGLDSLLVVEAVFAIEEAFDLHVPFNANDPGAGGFDVSSVQGVVDGVERLVRERERA